MKRLAALAVGVAALSSIPLMGQTAGVGDRTTPLRPVAAEGNVGISNAVLLDQNDARILRLVVEPGGTRIRHQYDDVPFHLFIPISGPMRLNLEGTTVELKPWQPYLMKRSTSHGFHNPGASPVEIMEVFIK